MIPRPLAWLTVVCLLVVGSSMLALANVKHECPAGKICIDPKRTSCFVFDMGSAGWRPVDKDERHYISARVVDRKALYKFQAQGVDCYQRDENFVLGEKIASFPVEWWKPSK